MATDNVDCPGEARGRFRRDTTIVKYARQRRIGHTYEYITLNRIESTAVVQYDRCICIHTTRERNLRAQVCSVLDCHCAVENTTDKNSPSGSKAVTNIDCAVGVTCNVNITG